MAGSTGKTVVFRGPHRRLVVGTKTLERDGDPVALTAAEWAQLEAANKDGRWRIEEQPGKAGNAEQGSTTGAPAGGSGGDA